MERKEQVEELTKELFENPTVQYRGIPFWSWNCRVTEELIDWQLDCFKAMGFGGVDIHPRTGLDTAYLGEEYLRLTKYAVQKCKEKGLICWLYDDDRFPSGTAGGIVTKERWTRGRYLWLTEKHREQTDNSKECRETTADKPKAKTGRYVLSEYCLTKEELEGQDSGALGYYVGAFSVRLEQGYLAGYRWLGDDDAVEAALAAGERVRFLYVKLIDEERWFEGQAYVDTMNPTAIRAFLDSTHEKYYELLGDEFGKSIPAIFTDEPRMAPRKKRAVKITFAESHEDIILPYTEYCGEQMREKYGVDVLKKIPEYIWDLPGGEKSPLRYQYQEILAECFVSSFLDQICDWCKDHGIYMTGHVLGEDSVSGQAWTLGDCMRCYRKMDLPGVDVLVDYRQFLTVKQASSVAKQNGKEGTVSELYGVTQWDCDFKTYKLQGDWQAALGITVRVPHLAWMSMEGEAKRDWPASIFMQSPWYREYPYIEDYFARLNTVLTRGKACTCIGMLHPVESAWLEMGPYDQTKASLKELDDRTEQIVKWLLFGALDFDLISEALLEEQCEGECCVSGKKLSVGEMEYSVLILPFMKTIRSSTLKVLEQFSQNGGEILILGEIPRYVDGMRSHKGDWLEQKGIKVPFSEECLLGHLKKCRDVEIIKEKGGRSDNLFYQFRQEPACKWLFLCHVNPSGEDPLVMEKYEIHINGTYKITLYDGISGKIKQRKGSYEGGKTILHWNCYAHDSLLLRLEDRKEIDCSEVNGEYESGILAPVPEENGTKIVLEKPDFYRCMEPNMLLLDYASYRVDGGKIYERKETLRLDNHIRSMLGFALRQEESEQPWFLEEKECHKVELFYSFYSEIEEFANLGIERPESCQIWLNGVRVSTERAGYYVDPAISVIRLPRLKRGENCLKVEVRYHQKTNLENLYLLGDFGVEFRENRPGIVEKCKELKFGDITGQSMPFYTGNLDYHFRFYVSEEGEYCVQIPEFSSPVLSVYVDGTHRGLIAYAPHSLSLGLLSQGEHSVTIRLFGNRHNGFGYLHNCNANFEWYGPAAYRTTGADWTEQYLVRPVGILSAVIIGKCEERK